MKREDCYLKFVRWSDEDRVYVGYCPYLFPWGGVCHGKDEGRTYARLLQLVRDEVKDMEGKKLPVASTRPMRDAVGA